MILTVKDLKIPSDIGERVKIDKCKAKTNQDLQKVPVG